LIVIYNSITITSMASEPELEYSPGINNSKYRQGDFEW